MVTNRVKSITGVVCCIVLLFSNSCIGSGTMAENDKLSIKKEPYKGNELRIDGYYYHKYGNPENYDIFFLYANGIILYGSSPETTKLDEYEEMYKSGEYHDIVKNYIYHWGVFKIDGNTITYEKWVPSSGGPLPAYTFSGIILSQTSFKITKSWRETDKAGTIADEDITYTFKEFKSKPSSENSFIE